MAELIALDYGSVNIGVARANDVAKIPEALASVPADNLEKLDEVISEHKPELIVLGLPRNLSGANTQQTAEVLDFKTKLEQRYRLPVALQDEALTSVMAEEMKTDKQSTDSVAACIILEDYFRDNKL